MIEVKNVLTSVCKQTGQYINTLACRYPRFIHSELMTHRAFSRNASSSRAIPVKKMVQTTLDDMAFFESVGTNNKGMQSIAPASPQIVEQFRSEWEHLGHIVAGFVTRWGSPESEGGYNLHKQVANRALEPWTHISVLITSTEWFNFLKLRHHPDADPTFEALASKVKSVLTEAAKTAQVLRPGEWHLPYIRPEEEALSLEDKIIVSTARCSRVSYNNHEGKVSGLEEDRAQYQRLVGSSPKHASPLEHPAMCTGTKNHYFNLQGWASARFESDRPEEFKRIVVSSTTGKKIDPEGVNHPAHYNAHVSGVETIEVNRYLTSNLGAAWKYLTRRDLKEDKIRDLKKVLWYLKDEYEYLPPQAPLTDPARLKMLRVVSMEEDVEIKVVMAQIYRYVMSGQKEALSLGILELERTLDRLGALV